MNDYTTVISCDSLGAMALAGNPEFHAHSPALYGDIFEVLEV